MFAKPGLPPSGRGEILLLLLNALRNASFVPSNERCIGHSARAVQVRERGCRARARACAIGFVLDLLVSGCRDRSRAYDRCPKFLELSLGSKHYPAVYAPEGTCER